MLGSLVDKSRLYYSRSDIVGELLKGHQKYMHTRGKLQTSLIRANSSNLAPNVARYTCLFQFFNCIIMTCSCGNIFEGCNWHVQHLHLCRICYSAEFTEFLQRTGSTQARSGDDETSQCCSMRAEQASIYSLSENLDNSSAAKTMFWEEDDDGILDSDDYEEDESSEELDNESLPFASMLGPDALYSIPEDANESAE